ncbi:MAG: LysR family transcriptional regulator [Eggerthellaceae bacterium]|jgi:DNA-binding transcriptional LysR family regulator|nr:LysR family transcriptional regulator [Eggerthellaceae bacterium]MCH4221198.1 LysR family transcriptional regulator [Eggerthellaceae bacterium]
MELRVLRYFLAVAQERNITAAAHILHVSQPTLSKQLMDLEKELGVQLYTRGSRHITLTNEGLFLRKRAREIIDLADRTQHSLGGEDSQISGKVCIGAGETPGFQYLTRALKQEVQEHPNVQFDLFSGNGEDVAERLDDGLLDFGLFVGQVDLQKYDYVHLPLEHYWGLILRADNPLAAHTSITPDDLQKIPFIHSRQTLISNEMAGWLGTTLDSCHIIGTYNLIFNAKIAVEEGIGSALGIDGLIDPDDPNLCFRPLDPPLRAGLTVAWKKYQVFSPAAQCFLDTLRSII